MRKSKANIKEKEHHESKHSKLTLFTCFPCLDPAVIAAKKAVPVAAPKYKPDKPLIEKKKKKKRK